MREVIYDVGSGLKCQCKNRSRIPTLKFLNKLKIFRRRLFAVCIIYILYSNCAVAVCILVQGVNTFIVLEIKKRLILSSSSLLQILVLTLQSHSLDQNPLTLSDLSHLSVPVCRLVSLDCWLLSANIRNRPSAKHLPLFRL